MARKDLTQRMKDAMHGIMDEEMTEFIMTCSRTSTRLRRPLTLSQEFEVLLYLGYRKVAPKGKHKLWENE